MADNKSITNQKIIDWVSGFLWHWQNSGALYGDAVESIVKVVETHLGDRDSGEPNPFPDAQALVKELEKV